MVSVHLTKSITIPRLSITAHTVMAGKQIIPSSLRRTARPAIHISRQCRNFATTPNRPANTARGLIARQMGKEKTMQSRMSKAKGADIPDDLGYFPETLIKPDRKDLPSLLSSPKRRLLIEWTAFWQKFRDFGRYACGGRLLLEFLD